MRAVVLSIAAVVMSAYASSYAGARQSTIAPPSDGINVNVYYASGEDRFHASESCPELHGKKTYPIRLLDTSVSHMVPCPVCATKLGQLRDRHDAMERDYTRGVIYLVTSAEPAHAKPDPTSAKVGEVNPTIGLLVFATSPGWVQVGLPDFERGWIRGDVKNIIHGDQLTVPMREVKMKGKPWAPAVRLDILRGIVRLGFTKEQVEIARHVSFLPEESGLLYKESEETAAGITDTWTYQDAVYVFTNGKVSKIKKVE
jgi:hypothetical protein